MSTIVKPKAPRESRSKKNLPKSNGRHQQLVAGEGLPPSMTSQTLPDGIAHLDPDARAAAADAQAQPPEQVQLGEVTQLRIDWLARHPRNRKPKGDKVIERAASMGLEGQLEPLVVRELPDNSPGRGVFEILSGETRWLAAQLLGWKTIAARVVQGECDDARALDLLALYNGQRTDLDPIEKARMIEDLCQAGRTREQAAIEVGLQSGSAASNLVRLLELPQVWQDRVAAGELPESFARLLVPLAKAPRLLELLEKDWSQHLKIAADGDDQDDTFVSRGAVEYRLKDLIDCETRPIEAGVLFDYPYAIERKHGLDALPWSEQKQPILFELNDDLREKLQIVEFTVSVGVGKKAKNVMQARAVNVELWDKHQIPEMKKLVKELANRSAKKDEKKVAAKKELTPTQQKAKDKERAEQLVTRINAWRHRWLCSLVADRLATYDEAQSALVAWLMVAGTWRDFDFYEAALTKLGAKPHNEYAADEDELWKAMLSNQVDAYNGLPQFNALNAMCECALRTIDKDPKHLKMASVIDDLARWCAVDLETEWRVLQQEQEANPRFEEFLQLHNGDQLDALGKELEVYVDGIKTKAAKVTAFIYAPRTLAMPNLIKPLVVPEAKPAPKEKAKPAAKKKGKGAR